MPIQSSGYGRTSGSLPSRHLIIYELTARRIHALDLPTSIYNHVAIRGDKVVVWSTNAVESVPFSMWDSTFQTLQHFQSPKSGELFTVTWCSGEAILLSGIDLSSKSASITAGHYDALGNLDLSQSIALPGYGFLSDPQPRTSFFKILLSDRDYDDILRTDYVFSSSPQKIANASLHYNATTRRLSWCERSSQLPVMRSSMKKSVKYLGLYGHAIHTRDVFSIAYKGRPSSGSQRQRSSCFKDKHVFYCWLDDQTLTLAASEISSINLAIYEDPDEHSPRKRPWECFGDEQFLVKCVGSAVEIYCFDKDFQLAKEYEPYRHERNRRALKRSNKRKIRAARIVQS